jgi:2-iminobutanoate/2-iminopropanoate deaminase
LFTHKGDRNVVRKIIVNPPTVAPPLYGYYSNSVKVTAGPLLFITGLLGLDVQGRLIGADNAAAQTEQIFVNLKAILAASGATLEDVVQATVYLTDIEDMTAIRPVRARHFPKDGPASVLVAVSGLAFENAKIEMDAIAVVP